MKDIRVCKKKKIKIIIFYEFKIIFGDQSKVNGIIERNGIIIECDY